MSTVPDRVRWHTLCRLNEIEVGRAKYVEFAGRGLSVVRSGEASVMVIDDACPHAGMSLSGGHVEGGCFVCPWHSWEFRLCDGRNPDNPDIVVPRYEARVDDGLVQVRVSP